ncbi:hypothetical protein AcV7_004476 [Taiwanofungus camphoratus]|nr:hypothetical protein AcV7_004476 [Antrodia cinnamomea]
MLPRPDQRPRSRAAHTERPQTLLVQSPLGNDIDRVALPHARMACSRHQSAPSSHEAAFDLSPGLLVPSVFTGGYRLELRPFNTYSIAPPLSGPDPIMSPMQRASPSSRFPRSPIWALSCTRRTEPVSLLPLIWPLPP